MSGDILTKNECIEIIENNIIMNNKFNNSEYKITYIIILNILKGDRATKSQNTYDIVNDYIVKQIKYYENYSIGSIDNIGKLLLYKQCKNKHKFYNSLNYHFNKSVKLLVI